MVALERTRAIPWMLAIALLAGCSKSDLDSLVDKVKDTTAESTKKVKDAVAERVDKAGTQVQEQLALAGRIELTLDAPLQTKACYARILPQASGRPTVFQLRSYRTVDGEEFPSVFLQAQVTANSLAELHGQIISARLFVQPQADGPVWFSETGSPVELKVVGMEDELLVAELVGGSLHNTQSGAETAVQGKFSAVLR